MAPIIQLQPTMFIVAWDPSSDELSLSGLDGGVSDDSDPDNMKLYVDGVFVPFDERRDSYYSVPIFETEMIEFERFVQLPADASYDLSLGFSGNDPYDFTVLIATGAREAGALTGAGQDDFIFDSAFGNRVNGRGGDDVIDGGGGDDTLSGGAGDNTLRGGAGDDVMFLTRTRQDYTDGGEGFDTVDFSQAAAAIQIDDYGPNYNSIFGVENIVGTKFSDLIDVEAAARTDGGAGNDTIGGGEEGNLLIGGAGNDNLFGADGADTLQGGTGKDTIDGAAGFDALDYRDAARGVAVDLALKVVGAGAQADQILNLEAILGSRFADALLGDKAANALYGGGDADTLAGRSGNDSLFGGGGADRLTGDLGADQLTGGLSSDLFVFSRLTDSAGRVSGRDVILDLRRGEGDRIDLSALDADATAAGNQAFAFIGKSAFSANPGEVRFVVLNGSRFLYANVDRDADAEFSLEVAAGVSLIERDFIL